ncbi:hypothetical protein [Couchioplanes caeruleus]|uniref:Uncharacterized protein n=1 Tax=Couchioplanes caeruleus TaxID=56438 RepID=A0A3N1GKX7_9ACTN|nr:hypothetical protein [Couchioplanes caeruleus]ROP30884.1 hypothetical protein EDD30_3756 [Couchioplanes caeruleus]
MSDPHVQRPQGGTATEVWRAVLLITGLVLLLLVAGYLFVSYL